MYFKQTLTIKNIFFLQGDLVKSLKQGKAEKSEWEPYVKGLLEMKKSLEQMKIASNPISIDDLEKEISKQVI
jgi:hypothetical protein